MPIALSPAALALAAPAHASDADWARASTISVGALAAWSIGVPLVKDDGHGARQAALSIGAAEVTTQVLKRAIDEQRPDLSGNDSFPSGHTSAAFAAAASIYRRRGPAEGVPALALAGFTGLARVEAHKHHWHDVFAGAAIGGLSGAVLTDPHRPGMGMALEGDTHGGGVSVAMVF